MKIRRKQFFIALSRFFNRAFLSAKKRSGNEFKNEYNFSCKASGKEHNICNIQTKKIVTDLIIRYQVLIDNILIRELEFKNDNGTAGVLLCKIQYRISPVTPILLYEQELIDLSH